MHMLASRVKLFVTIVALLFQEMGIKCHATHCTRREIVCHTKHCTSRGIVCHATHSMLRELFVPDSDAD